MKTITTPKGKVLVDESAEIKEGDYIFSAAENRVIKTQYKVNDGFYNRIKIIATINHSISLDVPMVIVEDAVNFCKTTEVDLKEIAALAFGHKEWITTGITVRYNPHIKEHYEDADEYFEMNFEGYFAGNNKAFYRVQLRPSMNVALWYSYKEEKNKVLHTSNQSKIQNILSKYKAAQQKGVYSEADLRLAFKAGQDYENFDCRYAFNEYIKSLNQEPIELETEDSKTVQKHEFDGTEHGEILWVRQLKTTRGSDGQLMAYLKQANLA